MTRTGAGRSEHGGVSVVMIAVLVVGLVLVTGAARLGTAMVARGKADLAADAAALAAADTLALGRGAAAARAAAASTAASNDARLVVCRCVGTIAEVVVEVRVALPGNGHARSRARAEVRPECMIERAGCG